MDDKYDKYLPIGSVVILKKGRKALMITGYKFFTIEDVNNEFDYCGCLYPEGVLNNQKTILFNHSQIEQVLFVGFSCEGQREYLNNFLLKDVVK